MYLSICLRIFISGSKQVCNKAGVTGARLARPHFKGMEQKLIRACHQTRVFDSLLYLFFSPSFNTINGKGDFSIWDPEYDSDKKESR